MKRNDSDMALQYRYPGAKPFQTDESHVFYGRDGVSQDLYQLIRLEPLVVLHAKSGLGKSSLINAGLLPKVRDADEYQPINIRFHAFTDGKKETPFDITRDEVQSRSDLLDKIRPKGDDSLWYHLKSLQLATSNDKDILLIFDQFEELFTYQDSTVEEFARQLSEALYSTLPQRYRDQRKEGFEKDNNFLTDEELAILDQPLNLRLLMAIRSDRMSLMKKIKEYFPTILSADFELQPLTLEQAEDAILSPAYEKAGFITPVFDYNDDAIEYLLDFLSEDRTEPIESFQLQILCEYVEQHLVGGKGKLLIQKEDIANPDLILENYYLDKINSIINPEHRLAARRLIEEGFIFEEEERRLALYEGQIFKSYGINQDLLNKLLDTHLIRSEPSLRGGYTYELSHDTLVVPVLKAKAKRREIEQLEKKKEAIEKRETELVMLRKKEEAARQQAEKEKQLRTDAESNEKRARQRTRLASVVSILALLLSGFAFIMWRSAEDATSMAEAAATAAQNASLVLRLAKTNPTLAIRIADYNQKKYPDNPAARAAFSEVISDKDHRFYKKEFQGHSDNVNAVIFSPNGKNILTGSFDKTAKLWDLDGEEIQNFEGHTAEVTAVAFSPDGKNILTGSFDNTAKLWDLDGEEIQNFEGHTDYVTAVAFSPDGKSILTGSYDETAKLWNMEGKEIQNFKGHRSLVTAVAFSPDGKNILTGSFDRTAKLWNMRGKEIQNFKGHTATVSAIAFSPDGQNILTGSSDNTVKLWNMRGKEIQNFKGHTDRVTSVVFSPDGKNILTGNLDNTAKLWDMKGKALQRFQGHSADISAVAFSPDGKNILTGSSDNMAKLWDLEGKEIQIFQGHSSYVTAVAFSLDRKNILTGCSDYSVKLWDMEGKEIQNFKGHSDVVDAVAFSPDSKNILTGSLDKTAKLWDMEGKEIQIFQGHSSYVTTVAFSPDGKNILTGSFDETAKLWDLEGNELQNFRGHTDDVNVVAFSPDGKSILTGSYDETAKLWNMEGKEIQNFKGHMSYLTAVAFSPDGKNILTGSFDETAKLWDLDGKELRNFQGHTAEVTSIAFSPDGKNILTGSGDNTAKLWDLDGKEIQSFQRHTAEVSAVTFTPDGKSILTVCTDESAKLWLLPQDFFNQKVREFTMLELYDAGMILDEQDLKKVKQKSPLRNNQIN